MGHKVIFLPGTLTDERIWSYQRPLFSDSVVVNLRQQDSLEKMLDEVSGIEGESFHLVGFSMGGHVAQEFAIKCPERVKTLTVIGSSSMGYPAVEREIIKKTLHLIVPGQFKGITEKRLREYLHPHSYENHDIKQLIKDMAGADAAEVYLRQLKATLDRRVMVNDLAKLTCPINYVAGREDQIIKLSTIQESQSSVPGSKLYIIEECGHFIPLERPQELNQILLSIIS